MRTGEKNGGIAIEAMHARVTGALMWWNRVLRPARSAFAQEATVRHTPEPVDVVVQEGTG